MMRRCTTPFAIPCLTLALLGFGGLLATGCAPPQPAVPHEAGATTGLPTRPGDALTEISGQVTKVGDFGWGLVPDADPGTRYAPDQLADEFHQDGLPVVFSGVLGEIPPGARLWGTPLRLTAIRRLAG